MDKLIRHITLCAVIVIMIVAIIKLVQEPEPKIHTVYVEKPVFIEIPATVEVELGVDVQANVPLTVEQYEVTAYTAGYESTGKSPGHPQYGVTASGSYVQAQHTLACPPVMDFGTEVYIPYFGGWYTCEDRGAAITDGKLDVYMPGVRDALRFGRRHLDVVILTEKVGDG